MEILKWVGIGVGGFLVGTAGLLAIFWAAMRQAERRERMGKEPGLLEIAVSSLLVVVFAILGIADEVVKVRRKKRK